MSLIDKSKKILLQKIVGISNSPTIIKINKSIDKELARLSDKKLIKISSASLKDLFDKDNANFVKSIYRILLEREVDPEGLNFYLGKLASGLSRTELIYQILRSSEGSKSGVKVIGLAGILDRYKKSFKSPLGMFYRIYYNMDVNTPYYSDIASTLNRLDVSINELSKQILELNVIASTSQIESLNNINAETESVKNIDQITTILSIEDSRAKTLFNNLKVKL